MTGLDLINRSLRLLGVLASGESASSSEATDGLNSLNDLIDSWSNENLLIPNKLREVFPIVVNQQSYTWGTGGNFNSARPQKIENAIIQLNTQTPALEIPLKILTKDQYAGIILKGIISTFPLYIYYDNAFPLGSVNVWPIGNQAGNNLVFYSWKPLTDVASLTTVISLPPGYARALRYNLAIELAPEYGKTVSPEVISIAEVSRANIKRMNMNVDPKLLRVDDEIMSKPAVWNWLTGEPT